MAESTEHSPVARRSPPCTVDQILLPKKFFHGCQWILAPDFMVPNTLAVLQPAIEQPQENQIWGVRKTKCAQNLWVAKVLIHKPSTLSKRRASSAFLSKPEIKWKEPQPTLDICSWGFPSCSTVGFLVPFVPHACGSVMRQSIHYWGATTERWIMWLGASVSLGPA